MTFDQMLPVIFMAIMGLAMLTSTATTSAWAC